MTDRPPEPPRTIGNVGEPIRLPELNLAGVSVSTAAEGETVEILARYGTTSDQYFFHVVAKGLAGTLRHALSQAGVAANLEAAAWVVAHIKPDKTADLWLDKAAVTMSVRLKHSVEAGSAVFQDSILDVTTITFPAIAFQPGDQVIILFRVGWRFGLYFDLSDEFDQALMERTLGRLYRGMLYYERYAALSNPSLFDKLIETGWFPFLELENDEFAPLYGAAINAEDIERCGQLLLTKFAAERVDNMGARWFRNALFQRRKPVLRSGLESFKRNDPVAAIKTLCTELEGILQDAYIGTHSTNAKTGGLIRFANEAATQKAGGVDTLFFPSEFQRYLEGSVYKGFDPLAGDATASRHGAAHGAAPPETYTQARALQIILTLDQISHYL